MASGAGEARTSISPITGNLLALLTALPFAFAVRPQQDDYPSHLARYHVMLERDGNAVLQRFYDFDWMWNGNLGVDLLMVPLGRLLGVETGAWLIALLLPPLTALGILAVEWTLRRRIGIGALLALALVWSPAMLMGFANFSLALALALFAFAAWVKLERWPWRAALFVPIGLIVWLAHSAGWGVLGVLVFGYEWQRRKTWQALLAPWPLFFPVLALAAQPGIGGSFDYGADAATYKLAIWLKAMAASTMQVDLLSLLVIVACIAMALRLRRIDGRLGWAALLLAGLTLAMPRHFGGGDYADWRLIAVTLMIACLAIDFRPSRLLLGLALVLFLGRLGLVAADWHTQSQRLEAALAGLDKLPRGARVAGAVAFHGGRWGHDPLAHAPSYAAVHRDALVNSHFAVNGVHMLSVKGADGSFVDPSQRAPVTPGQPLDLSTFAPARQADYLWYFGTEPVARLPEGAKVLHRSEASLLARLAPD